MPYGTKEKRAEISKGRRPRRVPDNPGELNFRFTEVLLEYLTARGLSYQTINDIVGALEGAKVEFQRRVVGIYEDKKIFENGDVYPKEFLRGVRVGENS